MPDKAFVVDLATFVAGLIALESSSLRAWSAWPWPLRAVTSATALTDNRADNRGQFTYLPAAGLAFPCTVVGL